MAEKIKERKRIKPRKERFLVYSTDLKVIKKEKKNNE